jgi:sulfoxide reductase heme-binding subunit YedZ
MTVRVDPANYLWWLVSRAAGIVALGLISMSVLIGLAMATKILRRPGLNRKLARLHEHAALISLAAIVVHGASLLGDRWLHPGFEALLVPFAIAYRPLYTALGIVAAYLAALLGLSFYARRRIGARLWRKLHRATVLVWVLGVIHTIGAGSDASSLWLRATMLVTGAPIVFLALRRALHHGPPTAARAARKAPMRPEDFAGRERTPAPLSRCALDRADYAGPVRPRPAIADEGA